MYDANFFEQRRKQEVDELPAVNGQRRDDWIAEKQADQEENRAVPNAGQYCDGHIGKRIFDSASLEKTLHSIARAEWKIEQKKRDDGGRDKEDQRCQQT